MISELMRELEERVDSALSEPIEIRDTDAFPTLEAMYTEKSIWLRVLDVVCVVADLKGSTKLNFDKYAPSSARLYEALTGNMVRIVGAYAPDFVDIQGDGLFALYHGERRYERAMCAGISLKTFSENILVPRVKEHFSDRFPKTGLKVGMNASRVVVKKVGVRGTTEPVWAGKLVNWAVKAAQAGDAHELVATQRVYEHFSDNELVTHSCGCPEGVKVPLWSDRTVSALPETDALCRALRTKWCDQHGDAYNQAILEGKKKLGE